VIYPQTIACSTCGYPLGHINEACPRCLPGFYWANSELETVRRERDEFRDRWLKQVDINDRLRARLSNLEFIGCD
jgi:hypothetical protein